MAEIEQRTVALLEFVARAGKRPRARRKAAVAAAEQAASA
jgi:hypothetical protein